VAVAAWQQREGMAERGNEWMKKEEKKGGERRKVRRQEGGRMVANGNV